MKSGILPIYKPEGISSAGVVARVKKKLGRVKIGHAGTLDPFATGLLLCCINKGTKISRFFLGGSKHYTADLQLGVETDTGDCTGQEVSRTSDDQVRSIDTVLVADAVASFLGPQMQTPPSFSALKHKGQPLYKLARQGIHVEKPPRPIEIYNISVTCMRSPLVSIDVKCSAGTYIRRLAEDIGKKLGCGAHLSALCRTGSSHFSLDEAITLDAFEKLDPEAAFARMIPLSEALAFMPAVIADEKLAQKIRHGQPLTLLKKLKDADTSNALARIIDQGGELLAVVEYDGGSESYNYCCVLSN